MAATDKFTIGALSAAKSVNEKINIARNIFIKIDPIVKIVGFYHIMPKNLEGKFMSDFAKLPLDLQMLENIKSLGYLEMTDIQEIALPRALDGVDLIVQAKTGSGKTAIFGLGIISKINISNQNPQALILCPTRELAAQVASSLRKFARHKPNVKILELCGGMPMKPQIASLEFGAHVLVATPGRFDDHWSKGTLKLDDISTFVLDEADKMLDMGFVDEISKIASNIPAKRQTMLFSATFPPKIKQFSSQILNNPEFLKTATVHSNTKIEHHFFEAGDIDVADAVDKVLSKFNPKSAIIFCNTKIESNELTSALVAKKHSAICLNGDLDQFERNETIIRFSNKSIAILVCTDVASRGLDIDGIDLVVNINLPNDNEVYIHRAGRSARKEEAKGICVTILQNENFDKFEQIKKSFDAEFEINDIRSFGAIKSKPISASKFTLVISSGKKNKIRAGDILGALVNEASIDAGKIGKIDVTDFRSYVSLENDCAKNLNKLNRELKIKGKIVKFFRFSY